MRPFILAVLIALAIALGAPSAHAQYSPCGFPPFPPFGAHMVCIDGRWHAVYP
jgi:hypothetical protein